MTYIFKNDSFLSFRCTSEEFHNFFTNIVFRIDMRNLMRNIRLTGDSSSLTVVRMTCIFKGGNLLSFRARPVGRRGISFLSDYHSERMWEIFVFRGAVILNEHEESQSIVLSNAVGSSYIEFSWQEILYFMLFCSERQNEKEKAFGNSISWNDSTFCEA